jgi:hypothetical protein
VARGFGHSSPRDPRSRAIEGSHKIRHRIHYPEDSFQFLTGTFDGHIVMCLFLFSASETHPVHMTLNITQRPTLYDPEAHDHPDRQHTVSPITNELRNMERLLLELSTGANSNRDRTVGYHRLTLSLNQAVRYWPIFKIIIMVLTGALQVHYIVRYMKTIWLIE